uniref:Angiopoietin-1 receptor-like n=1 Tax=Crassostrea virginica TaxID=6565 RepID=A0A8B8BFY0_CRAVI|nr:angiopoietin-1 receptor-like [Crassostrea virginica]
MAAALTSLCLPLFFVAPVWTYLQLVEPGYTKAMSSSTYHGYPASRTVDGNLNQSTSFCSHTDDYEITEAWLRIDLQKIFNIAVIKIWYRNDKTSCYTDPGNVTLPTIIENHCERTARYVWIYQDKSWSGEVPMLAICEVQVLGCFLGEYGENCTKICNHCKNNLSCDTESGRCNSEGCALSGFQMPYCQNCSSGLYGVYCEKTCSEFCKNENCDKTTGTCANGCRSGYTGRHCNETCDVGEYGQDCGYNCSEIV